MNPRHAAALALAALLAGCIRPDAERLKADLITTDKAFSVSSSMKGPKAAFIAAIARDCKLLNDSRIGADAVNDVFIQYPASVSLTWEPAFADVSASGELGYTWGRYVLTVPVGKLGTPPLIRRGTYVTVWKRQYGSGWKVVLSGSNLDGAR